MVQEQFFDISLNSTFYFYASLLMDNLILFLYLTFYLSIYPDSLFLFLSFFIISFSYNKNYKTFSMLNPCDPKNKIYLMNLHALRVKYMVDQKSFYSIKCQKVGVIVLKTYNCTAYIRQNHIYQRVSHNN